MKKMPHRVLGWLAAGTALSAAAGPQPPALPEPVRAPAVECITRFDPSYDTQYLTSAAIAVELRRRMLCLAAQPSGLDAPVDLASAFPQEDTRLWSPARQHQGEALVRAQQTADANQRQRRLQTLRTQATELAQAVARRERAESPAAAVLNERSWARLHSRLPFDQNQALIQATGAQLELEQAATPQRSAWSLWFAKPSPETMLITFLADDPATGGSRFQELALIAPGQDASVWADAFRQYIEADGEKVSARSDYRCIFGRATYTSTFEYPRAVTLRRQEGDEAVVAFDSHGGGAAFRALLPYVGKHAPHLRAYMARYEMRSEVPGAHSPHCDTQAGTPLSTALGEPGMPQADFRRLWGGGNGGRFVVNGQALDVLPEYADGAVKQLFVQPAIDYRASGLYNSPDPLWVPSAHQQVVETLSRAFGPPAFERTDTDLASRPFYRTVWRLGADQALVLTNWVKPQPQEQVSTEARLLR